MFVGLSFPLYLEQIHKPCSGEVLPASEKAAELFPHRDVSFSVALFLCVKHSGSTFMEKTLTLVGVGML